MLIKSVEELEEGMVLARPIYNRFGNILLEKGQELNNKHIEKILNNNIDYVHIDDEVVDINDLNDSKQDKFYETKKETKKEVKDIFKNIVENKYIELSKYEKVINEILEDILSKDGLIVNINNLKDLSQYYYEHAINSTVLAVATSLVLGLNRKSIKKIAIGTLIHDIGYINVPKELLNKNGKLENEEFKKVQTHTVFGYDLLKERYDLSSESLDIIKYHHENIDGSGYPEGLEKMDISVGAKICGICDTYDALLTNRYYRGKINRYKATKIIIQNIGKRFDKYVTKNFLKVVGHYPKGTHLILNNGYHVKVVKPKHFEPVVKVVVDNYGKTVDDGEVIDLSEKDLFIYDIDLQKQMYNNLLKINQ